jgi:hypothetical protein
MDGPSRHSRSTVIATGVGFLFLGILAYAGSREQSARLEIDSAFAKRSLPPICVPTSPGGDGLG